MNAMAVLEEVKTRGGEVVRDTAGCLRVRPSGVLDAALRARLKLHREELETLIPAQERIEDHIPAYLLRPCVSPRLHGDGRCRAYPERSGSLSTFAQKVRSEGRGCGDCDIAYTAVYLREAEAERERKAAKLAAKARVNAKYRQPLEDEDFEGTADFEGTQEGDETL